MRKTSCGSGWLRLVMQTIFATITVASFILIVIMAVKNPTPTPVLRPAVPPRCQIRSCSVVCKEVPYYGKYEQDILFALSEAETECSRVVLELHEPHFVNNTLPDNWLSRMHSNIYQLAIIRGNLMHIPAEAFMSQFTGNIVILLLQELNIKSWESNGLVGLSSLRTLNILNSQLESIDENVLKAVDDTLETLTITESGEWDPSSFTGSRGFEKLTIVDFSYNDFGSILGAFTFVGLEVTKILYLNSCRITAIGAGAFDHLLNIEVLYLNNNKLVSVPVGLFNPIVALENPRPRISLQDNYWYCDCAVDDLRQLIRKEILLVEPTCTYPKEMQAIPFKDFENICNNESTGAEFHLHKNYSKSNKTSKTLKSKKSLPDPVNIDACYCSGRTNDNTIRVISPLPNTKSCTSMKISHLNATLLSDGFGQEIAINHNKTTWPQVFYFVMTDNYSIIQIIADNNQHLKNGLVWFQSTCPHELFCLEEIPSFLRVYSTNINARYTFCLVNLDSARIENENCIRYELPILEFEKHKQYFGITVLWYLFTIFICLCFGAVMVYALIRLKPTLLRGSKRILFVKHKNVDALVLPPKVSIRKDLKTNVIDPKNKDIFTLSAGHNIKTGDLNRIKSVRSNKSGSPSYISAMLPTEDQLAEWRIRQHFNNDLTITSMQSELSTLSWTRGEIYYNSLNENDMTYESLK